MFEQNPDGFNIPRVVRVTELATGLNYKDASGQWVPSSTAIEPVEGGAVARQGQTKVSWANNLAAEWPIQIESPTGKRLRTRVVGVVLSDHTGKSVWIGHVKDSQGYITEDSAVIYPDCMEGIQCSLRIRYMQAGIEQDLLIEESLEGLGAAQLGLDPQTAAISLVTEFESAQRPVVSPLADSSNRKHSLTDSSIDFGDLKMNYGKAWLTDAADEEKPVRVYKQWLEDGGRQFLFEQIPMAAIEEDLSTLPRQEASVLSNRENLRYAVAEKLTFPGPQLTVREDKSLMRLASQEKNPTMLAALQPRPAFLLDYQIMGTSGTNFQFLSGMTYQISGQVNLAGTTRLQGGTVLKIGPASTAGISTTNLICETAPYRPAVFTSVNDDTCGETLTNSVGNPTTKYYGGTALNLMGAPAGTVVSGVFFSHLSNALCGVEIVLRDSQIVRCRNAFVSGSSDPTLENVLLYRLYRFMQNEEPVTVTGLNVTAHLVTNFLYNVSGTVNLTNCLLSRVNDWQAATTRTNATVYLSTDTGVFQTVGGGQHYLSAQSPYRGVGATNLPPSLLSRLRNKTSYPPTVYTSTTFTNDVVFGPTAPRNTNSVDIGYLYDPLDYAFGGSHALCNVTFSPGTAVGWFRTTSGTYRAGQGIHLGDQKTLKFDGLPEAPCYWVRTPNVQERLNGTWLWGPGQGGITGWASSTNLSPQVLLNFTVCASLAGEGNHFRDDSGWLTVRANHSTLWNGSYMGYYNNGFFTNCLFSGHAIGNIEGAQGNQSAFQNCTMRGGQVRFAPDYWTTVLTVSDTAFDNTQITVSGPVSLDADYNAYKTGGTRLTPNGTHDKIVTSFDWEIGPSGFYYLPTNSVLIDAGSRTADQAGLFHFTSVTSGQVEATSIVDIGYHYLPLAANGLPIDSDTDGTPDYLDLDSDGDGLPDAWELTYFGGLNRSGIDDDDGDTLNNSDEAAACTDPTDADTDYDGVTDWDELAGGTDPLDPASTSERLLALFNFDDSAWVGANGQLPKAFEAIQQVQTWSTNGLQIVDQASSFLAYNHQQTNGQPNINLRKGTVRFWFRPDWSSTTAGGQGPQTWGRLLEVGKYATGWGQWALDFDTGGNQIRFYTSPPEGTPQEAILSHAISWYAGDWHQVALTYGPESSSLYVDGFLVASGSAVHYWPSLEQRKATGLIIGNDSHFAQPAKGTFEAFETFNYELSASTISTNFQAVVSGDSDLDGMLDEWEWFYFGNLSQAADDDFDGDNLSNRGEFDYGTDPTEVATYMTALDPDYLFTAQPGSSATAAYLSIEDLDNGFLRFSVSSGIVGRPYDLYFLENLSWSRWQWRRVFCSAVCDQQGAATFLLRKPSGDTGFYVLLDAADDDGDGLSNGYESWFTYYQGRKSGPRGLESDGDKMPDGWEVTYGLDPTTTLNGQGASGNVDGDAYTNRLEFLSNQTFSAPRYDPLKHFISQVSRNVVSISSADSTASGPLNSASFTITRNGGDQGRDLVVYYAVGGSALYELDYTLDPAPLEYPRICSATIPANQSSVTVTVTPLALRATGEEAADVVIKLTPYAVSPVNQVQLATDWEYVVNVYKDTAVLRLNNDTPGFNGPIYALKLYRTAVYEGNKCVEYHQLIAGGKFTQVGAVAANNIARLNGLTGKWEPIGGGMDGPVYAIEAVERFAGDTSPDIYAGGQFTSPAAAIAKWSGAAAIWTRMGTGLNSSGFEPTTLCRVNAIRNMSNGTLWVGGRFSYAGGVFSPNFAKWDLSTQRWFPAGQNVYAANGTLISNLGLNSPTIMVTAIEPNGGSIALAQNGTSSAWQPLSSISGEAYYSVGEDGSLHGGGRSIISAGIKSVLSSFVGSYQPQSSVWDVNNFEHFEGNYSGASELTSEGWHLVGYNGFALPPSGSSAWWPVGYNSIPSGWKALGNVFSIVSYGDDYYFGGSFNILSGASAGQQISDYSGINNLFKWNRLSGTWTRLESSPGYSCVPAGPAGVNGTVYALAIDESLCTGEFSGLWVAGNFTQAGGGSAWRLAYWARDMTDEYNQRRYWVVPSVPSILSPQSGAVFQAGGSVPILASFASPGCAVTKVDFYSNGKLLTSTVAPPYSFTWSDITKGTYTIKAVATFADGKIAFSEPVVFNVE